jgi:hypothetical protein
MSACRAAGQKSVYFSANGIFLKKHAVSYILQEQIESFLTGRVGSSILGGADRDRIIS